jgi:hypothetical protein
LYEIIEKKIKAGEDPAVAMTWDNTDDGVIFTFFPNENKINFLLMGRRMRHPELNDFTDVNWYLILFYKPLMAKGVNVSKFEFSEIM